MSAAILTLLPAARRTVNACQTSCRLRNSNETLRFMVRSAYVSLIPSALSVKVRYLHASRDE